MVHVGEKCCVEIEYVFVFDQGCAKSCVIVVYEVDVQEDEWDVDVGSVWELH